MQLPREVTTQPDELLLQTSQLIRSGGSTDGGHPPTSAMHQISPKIESTDSHFNNNNNNGHSEVSCLVHVFGFQPSGSAADRGSWSLFRPSNSLTSRCERARALMCIFLSFSAIFELTSTRHFEGKMINNTPFSF